MDNTIYNSAGIIFLKDKKILKDKKNKKIKEKEIKDITTYYMKLIKELPLY